MEPFWLDLFADGSFCRELNLGAWAFCVPRLNLIETEASAGASGIRAEFLAVLHGLEEVLAVDSSDLPSHVFSDCNTTVAAITLPRDRQLLKTPRKYEAWVDLVPRLASVLERRLVLVARYHRRKSITGPAIEMPAGG